ncbi:MAG: DUF2064 domain-containing protein [Pseudomonadota bacterium]|nr:DUF2064 domain-containing protein [Pseudomonadota bacterium]
MTRPTLLIFTKPPRMGLSKTRLAADLGRTEARRIAHYTTAMTMRAARSIGWRVELHVAPRSLADETLGGLWPDTFIRRPQSNGNLGDRLTSGMHQAPHGPVVFIGTDAPGISKQHFAAASRALRHDGAVFGPAEDGGFWLFGISHNLRKNGVFSAVRWSGPHAMEDVWSNLPDHARIKLLPQLIDIDTGKDWKMFKNQP